MNLIHVSQMMPGGVDESGDSDYVLAFRDDLQVWELAFTCDGKWIWSCNRTNIPDPEWWMPMPPAPPEGDEL